MNSPPGSPTGPLWREMRSSRAFVSYISLMVPCKSVLPPGFRAVIERERRYFSGAFLHLSLKVPGKTSAPPGPQGAPKERSACFQTQLLHISRIAQRKGLLIKQYSPFSQSPLSRIPLYGPPTEPLWREILHFQSHFFFINSYLS